jgi:hypothetical protein
LSEAPLGPGGRVRERSVAVRLGAGTFGATAAQRPESTPRLYNLLDVWRDHSKVRVHTRCMRKSQGAWAALRGRYWNFS